MEWMRSSVVLFVLSLFACGGQPAPAAPAASGSTSPSDAGVASEVDATPKEKPFAKTQTEALSLIDDAITGRQSQIYACVTEARERRKDAHAKVTVDIAIDQEGTLIGTKTPKGAPADEAFNDCIVQALKEATFPRSNSGIITVNKQYADKVVYR